MLENPARAVFVAWFWMEGFQRGVLAGDEVFGLHVEAVQLVVL